MSTSIESSKFKSAFGNLKPVEPRRLNPKALANAQNRRANRKPLSFFDSQRVDPSMMYNTNDPQEGEQMYAYPGEVELQGQIESEMIDIND